MFNQTRYGRYTNKTYNNDGPATIKLLAFVAVVSIFGFSMYALFEAANSWTSAVGATWTAGNNDTLIGVIGGAIGDAIVLGTVVVSGLVTLAMLPWFIRNMRVALNAPIPGAAQRYNVIDADDEQTAGYIEDAPEHGLLVDSAHQEHYIDAGHQLPSQTQPQRFAQGFRPVTHDYDEAEL